MENTPRKNPVCPFCKPDDSHGHDRVLRRNASAYCMLSNPRRMAGHLLVIPVRHVERPWEVTSEELRDIFELISWTQQKILDGNLGTGVQVRQNYMPFAPEGILKVGHVHYHVMPRSLNDELYERAGKIEDELFEMLSDEERRRVETLFS